MGNKHIILIGFMGTGKSTIGKALADKMNKPFYDTDMEIVKFTQMKIPSIFETHGEKYFRELETKTLLHLVKGESSVIATGGGIILAEENRQLLKQHCLILLDATVAEIYNRVKRNTNRPLLAQDDVLKTIKELYDKRNSLYRSLTKHIIINENRPVEFTVAEIEKRILPSCIKSDRT